VSTLDNPWFTLLRFDIGDLVRLAAGPCPCGRTEGLTVASIEGRSRDVTFTAAGRTVTLKDLDCALAPAEALTAYFVEQTGNGRTVAHFQCRPGTEAVTGDAVEAGMRSVYGRDATLELRIDPAIPPEQSGKFRLARCEPLPSADALYA
jgi:phenylacetate-coenzyme A ligase PaaK-like adenylate-forming protein